MGIIKQTRHKKKVNEEVDKFSDLIESNFVDTYYNLTMKSLGAIDFFLKQCGQSNMLMLLDDDVTIKYPKLLGSFYTPL